VRKLVRPWQLLRAGPLTALVALTGTRQSDPALESLRQSYLMRRRIGLSLVLATWIVWVVARIG
jgi:hypothetical protein